MKDQVFRDPAVKDADSFRVVLNGKLLPHSWNSLGAAKAGLQVEKRRAARRAELDG
jgi:hypothetical protein